MIRTSLNLPPQLHHQLQFVAKDQKTTVSHVMRDILEQALTDQKNERMKTVYASLDKVKGIASVPLTDVASTINERLYGAEGGWKGQDE